MDGIEDVREHIERTALVPLFALPTAMTPMMQLSLEANATVAPINGALSPRLDGIRVTDGYVDRADDKPENRG